MEFERIIVEQRHKREATYLTTEANGFLTGSHGMWDWGLVTEGTSAAFPVCIREKNKCLQVTKLLLQSFGKLSFLESTSRKFGVITSGGLGGMTNPVLSMSSSGEADTTVEGYMLLRGSCLQNPVRWIGHLKIFHVNQEWHLLTEMPENPKYFPALSQLVAGWGILNKSYTLLDSLLELFRVKQISTP